MKREGRGHRSFIRFPALLSPRQLTAARSFFEGAPVQALLRHGDLFDHAASSHRSSRVAWVAGPRPAAARDDDEPSVPPWLHARLRAAARDAHAVFGERAARDAHAVFGERAARVGVDSRGRWTPRYEPVQYSEYGEGAHYRGWHTDAEAPEADPEDSRCLTVVLLLSERTAFSGGHFEARLGGKGKGRTATRVKLEAGDAIVFLSKHLWHRVAKCTGGLRQTLVFWVRRRGAACAARYMPASDGEDGTDEAASPS